MSADTFTNQVASGYHPKVASEVSEVIISAATPGTTYAASTVVDVRNARALAICIDFDAAAANDQLSFLPMFAFEDSSGNAPLATDDVWYCPMFPDAAPTSAAPGLTQLASVDMLLTHSFNRVTYRPLEFRSGTAAGATDEWRDMIKVDTSGARWFFLLYGNVRAAAGTLNVKVARIT